MASRLDSAARMRSAKIAAAALLLAVLAGPAAADDIAVAEPFPLRGEPTRLTVTTAGAPAAGVVVEVLYRPNSQTGSTETLPPTDATGTVTWTPTDAGIVTLTAREPGAEGSLATLDVAVRRGRFPPSGMAIMAVAGVLLFGGAFRGFYRLLRQPGRLPEEEPPST